MTSIRINIRTRNRFMLDLDQIIKDEGLTHITINSIATPQKQKNRYVLSKRQYGDRQNTYFDLEVTKYRDIIQVNPPDTATKKPTYPKTGKFESEKAFYDFLDKYPEFDRIPFSMENINVAVDEIDEFSLNQLENNTGAVYRL